MRGRLGRSGLGLEAEQGREAPTSRGRQGVDGRERLGSCWLTQSIRAFRSFSLISGSPASAGLCGSVDGR